MWRSVSDLAWRKAAKGEQGAWFVFPQRRKFPFQSYVRCSYYYLQVLIVCKHLVDNHPAVIKLVKREKLVVVEGIHLYMHFGDGN